MDLEGDTVLTSWYLSLCVLGSFMSLSMVLWLGGLGKVRPHLPRSLGGLWHQDSSRVQMEVGNTGLMWL